MESPRLSFIDQMIEKKKFQLNHLREKLKVSLPLFRELIIQADTFMDNRFSVGTICFDGIETPEAEVENSFCSFMDTQRKFYRHFMDNVKIHEEGIVRINVMLHDLARNEGENVTSSRINASQLKDELSSALEGAINIHIERLYALMNKESEIFSYIGRITNKELTCS